MPCAAWPQICSWRYEDSVKEYIDIALKNGELSADYLRTVYVGPNEEVKGDPHSFSNWGYKPDMSEDDRNEQIIDAIRKLLAANPNMSEAA